MQSETPHFTLQANFSPALSPSKFIRCRHQSTLDNRNSTPKYRCRMVGISTYSGHPEVLLLWAASFGTFNIRYLCAAGIIKFSYNERFILRSCSAAKNGQATINYFRPAANLFAGRQGRRWTRHRPIAQTVFGELAESSTPHWPKNPACPRKSLSGVILSKKVRVNPCLKKAVLICVICG